MQNNKNKTHLDFGIETQTLPIPWFCWACWYAAGCVLVQCERRWKGCTVGCWGAGGDMAHRCMCGAGAWVQAPNLSGPSFLLGWRLERLPLVSIHHLTASAMLRAAGELSQEGLLRWVWILKRHELGVRLPHISQATHWCGLQIWPSFVHSRYKIYRIQSRLHGIASFRQWHNGLVTLQTLSSKDCSKYTHAHIQKCNNKSRVLPPHAKSWIISKACTSGDISYGLQGWSPVKEWLHLRLREILVEAPDWM